MIKSFLEMNSIEKKKALAFISKNHGTYKSIEEFQNEIDNKICNFGEGVIFYFEDNEIKGKLSIILEVAEKLKTVYIVKIICPHENIKVLKELIEEAKRISNKYEARKVLLGIRDENLLKLLETFGLVKSYSSFNMFLENRDIQIDVLDKEKLSFESNEEYLDIYNRSFMDMPHGTFIELEDVEGYLNNENVNEEYFLIKDNSESIGFLNTTIEGNRAFFDIGLVKEYRGRGYGKRLLETAIDYLNKEDIENICLTVIEKNTVAFEMYKKRGFKVYNKISDWIEIS